MTVAHPFGRRFGGIALCGLLGACALGPPPEVVSLPEDLGLGFADPTRQAILHAASAFASPGAMAGRPWVAAQAVSEVEYLIVELDQGQRWIEMSGLAKIALQQARPEWRQALGIAQGAPPQAVIDALTGVRRGFGAQDAAAAAAALRPPLFNPGGQGSVALLSDVPPLPRTARAAMMVQQEMFRMDRNNGRSRPWR